MNIDNRMVLPPDVFLLPATQLPPNVRSQLKCADEDYAILRPGARSYSKIIDAQFAELLTQFRKPRSIAEAVIGYSWPRKIDPEQVLDDALAPLVQLLGSRLLVPEDSEDAARITASFQSGEPIDDFTVRRTVQVLDDSEIYQVEGSDGSLGALKIMRGADEQHRSKQIDREIAILQRLDGAVNPLLISSGVYAGRSYLITEWIEGKSAAVAATDIRRPSHVNARQELLNLCCALVKAYAHLHEQGVVHGDIHTRNIIVDASGDVKIIDYGLSCIRGGDLLNFANRGGVGFYFDPEYALACLGGSAPPMINPIGEQYSLAAILYFLLTGSDYTDFSYEQAGLLQQIVEEGPLPFHQRGVKPWPDVEKILKKALSKDPADRFRSLRELAEALSAVSSTAGDEGTTTGVSSIPVAVSAGQVLLDRVLQRLDHTNEFFASGVTNAPSCSITYGSAGIAYALYRISIARHEPRLLSLADLWCNKALRNMDQPTAFYHPRYDVREETVGRTTPYHTASGIFLVQALIAHARGDRTTQQQATTAYITASEAKCKSLDLTLGRSGTLLGCSLLHDIFAIDETEVVAPLRAMGNHILQGIWEEINLLMPIQEQRSIDYLGIAHGWAGILYATLRWCRSSDSRLPAALPDRLDQLAACAEPTQYGSQWPAILDRQIYMPGWCSGSAGQAYLWIAAHQAYETTSYLKQAEAATLNAWKASDTMPTLCCGLAGRSYALLKMYKHTGDTTWLAGAEEIAEQGVSAVVRNQDLVNSLYKGEVGMATLVAGLTDPGGACFPLFEEEGWPSAHHA